MDLERLLEPRVLLVSGKGGVGKSTVAAALAVAGARSGRRTCLVEVESRQTMSRLFETEPWDFTEREFRPGLWGSSVDAEASFAEYMEMFYGAKRLSKLVVGTSAMDFATTAAPGIKDVLLIGKVKEMERRRDDDGRFHYDLLVVDAPPTGRIVSFLRAPDATSELVNVGPIRSQAQSVVELLLDPCRTRAVLVTLLEEMPVTEAIEGVTALADVGVTLGATIANRVVESAFAPAAMEALRTGLDEDTLDRGLGALSLSLSDPAWERAADVLRGLGADHLARLDLQQEMRGVLAGAVPGPALELPDVDAPHFGEHEVGILADRVLEVAA